MANTSKFTGRPLSSVEINRSRYNQGGITEVTQDGRAGWWERRELPHKDDDYVFPIPMSMHQRPDLISYKLYGQANLAWIILQFNNIVDEKTELNAGQVIRAPSKNRVLFGILNQPTGGIEV